MTQPLVMFCQAWPRCTQAAACFTRIQEYLQLEQASLLPITSSFEYPDGSVTMETLESPTAPTGSVISLEHADISWSPGSEPVLRDISLIIRPGFTAIIGPVASGKSTLLSAMLGDAIFEGGSISPRLSAVAFCSQTPWIMDDTIRHNITGDLGIDQKRYDFCLHSCGLQEDLDRMLLGDQTLAGSNGASLSGGQRQRVICALPFADLCSSKSLYKRLN